MSLDLKTFKFPKVDGAAMVFPTLDAHPELLKEAKNRGFYNGHSPYNKLFSKLFFVGGRVKLKEGVDKEFREAAWSYCNALMRSWTPKHEVKEAVCAMIMSELLESNLETELNKSSQ